MLWKCLQAALKRTTRMVLSLLKRSCLRSSNISWSIGNCFCRARWKHCLPLTSVESVLSRYSTRLSRCCRISTEMLVSWSDVPACCCCPVVPHSAGFEMFIIYFMHSIFLTTLWFCDIFAAVLLFISEKHGHNMPVSCAMLEECGTIHESLFYFWVVFLPVLLCRMHFSILWSMILSRKPCWQTKVKYILDHGIRQIQFHHLLQVNLLTNQHFTVVFSCGFFFHLSSVFLPSILKLVC